MPPSTLTGKNENHKQPKVDLDQFGNKHMNNEIRRGDSEKGRKKKGDHSLLLL
jgi:hypothetical protein